MTELIPATQMAFLGKPSFADLARQANEGFGFKVQSNVLERDKALLVGIPFVITRATYRPVEMGVGFVSCEVTIGDAATLQHARARGWHATSMFDPEESLVFNDGSTGIRRNLTQMFHMAGMLDVGPASDDMYDRPWPDWASFTQSSEQAVGDDKVTIPDFTTMPDGKTPLAILCSRGLRASEYSYNGQPVTTFYLS